MVVVVATGMVAYWYLESLLSLFNGYRSLFDEVGFWLPRSLLAVLEVVLVWAIVCGLHRRRPAAGALELGLGGPWPAAIGWMALAVAPMWLFFAFTQPLAADARVGEVAYLALLSPFAEEVVFRGFAFGQLHRRAGWGLWPALIATSLLFGYGHAEDAGSLAEAVGLMLLTGFGAGVFAWLYARWRTLAAPIALHVLMNLAWNVWSVGESAIAGWVPFAFQMLTALLAIVSTIWLGRRGKLPRERL